MMGGRTNGTVSEDPPVGSLKGIRVVAAASNFRTVEVTNNIAIAAAISNFKVKAVPISEEGAEVVDKGKPEASLMAHSVQPNRKG